MFLFLPQKPAKILVCEEEQRFTVNELESDAEGRGLLTPRHVILALNKLCRAAALQRVVTGMKQLKLLHCYGN